jgi:hypothetical protein
MTKGKGAVIIRELPPLCLCLFAGFCGGSAHLNLAPFFFAPVMFITAPSRKNAFMRASAYYLTAPYGILGGAPVFFGVQTLAPLFGFIFWVTTALSLSLPWAIFWRPPTPGVKPPRRNLLFLLLTLLTLCLPPIGLWGWVNPLLCAGYLLPGAGFMGILAVISLWWLLSFFYSFNRRIYRALLFGIGCYALLMAADVVPPPRPNGWEGIHTSYGKLYSGSDDTLSQYERYLTLKMALRKSTAKYVVLPETVAGYWSVLTESVWAATTEEYRKEGRTYIVGAEIYKDGTAKYYNAAMIRGANSGAIYQRYPVPVSMWRPFSDTGAIADWFGGKNGIAVIDGQKAAILICYEPYLYYPCLVTMLFGRADLIVAISNSWWCKETNLPTLSDKSVFSWAKLYDIPAVTAKNM